MFTAEQKEKIKSSINYLEFYSKFIDDFKINNNIHWSCCKFHDDSTPSFSINLETGTWKCWGKCQESGDIFWFYKKLTDKSYEQSIIDIAQIFNINLELSEDIKNQYQYKKDLYSINNKVNKFYRKQLKNNKLALNYLLKERKISLQSINDFNLGSTSTDSKLCLELKDDLDLLKDLSLIKINDENQSHYDHFRGDRIIIPYIGLKNKISGFNSRSIDNINPKYLKTNKSEIFNKDTDIYGINLAYEFIKEYKTVILVEGEFDCIRAYENGFKNTVAISGLSLSDIQIKFLLNIANVFYVVVEDEALFTLDSKGQSTIQKLYNQITKNSFVKVKIIDIRNNNNKCDLDEFLLNNHKSLFLKKIKEAKLYNEFCIDQILMNANYSNLEEKKKYVYLLRDHLLNIKNNLDRKQYIELISNKIEVPENDIYRILNKKEKDNQSVTLNKAVEIKSKRNITAQKMIISSLFIKINKYKIITLLERLKVETYLDKYHLNIFNYIKNLVLLNYDNNAIMIEVNNNFDNKLTLENINDILFKSIELNEFNENELEMFILEQINCLRR